MLNKLFSILISKFKGEKFTLSEEIPFSYIFSVFTDRMIMFLRGSMIFFQPGNRIFVGSKVSVKAIKLIGIGKNLSIGKGCHIDAMSRKGIQLGNNVSIGKFTTIECTGSLKNLGIGLEIGNNVGMGTHGYFGCAGGVEIGDDTIFGNFVSIHAENHNCDLPDIPIRLQGVNRQGIKIGSNCWIGAKVTILDGVIIEDGCVIAAGALVNAGHYTSNNIYGGVPARLLKSRFND